MPSKTGNEIRDQIRLRKTRVVCYYKNDSLHGSWKFIANNVMVTSVYYEDGLLHGPASFYRLNSKGEKYLAVELHFDKDTLRDLKLFDSTGLNFLFVSNIQKRKEQLGYTMSEREVEGDTVEITPFIYKPVELNYLQLVDHLDYFNTHWKAGTIDKTQYLDWDQNLLNGEVTFPAENDGKIVRRFKDGQLHGKSKFYNKEGLLVAVIKFRKGKETTSSILDEEDFRYIISG